MSDGKARNKRTRNLVSLAAALAVLTAGAAFWAWQRADAPDDGAATCRAVLSELGVESTGSVHACGDALETAMTGKPAGAKAASAPTERMPEARSRNFEKVVSAFTKDVAPGEADIPEAIRGNVANAVTYYTDDVFQILTGQVDYSNEIDSTIPNDIDLSPETLSDFLRPLAADEEAFDSIRASVFRRIEATSRRSTRPTSPGLRNRHPVNRTWTTPEVWPSGRAASQESSGDCRARPSPSSTGRERSSAWRLSSATPSGSACRA